MVARAHRARLHPPGWPRRGEPNGDERCGTPTGAQREQATKHAVNKRSALQGAARSIGWTTNDFQYEAGFADLARGLAAIYAVHSATEDAWVAVAIAGGVFMALAGLNHV